jgi:hypothetical protein
MYTAERSGKEARLFINIKLLTLAVTIEIHLLIMGITFKLIGFDEEKKIKNLKNQVVSEKHRIFKKLKF